MIFNSTVVIHIVYLLLLRAIIEEKVCEEYIIESGREPIMVNNPTYSFFMEILTRPSRPEMLDKAFNIPFEGAGLRAEIKHFDEKMDSISSLESIGKLCEATQDELIKRERIAKLNGGVELKPGVLEQLAKDIGESIIDRRKKGLED